MTKLFFCADCATLLPIDKEPDEGDTCENCGCDLFENDPIVGQFEEADAKTMRSV